MGAGSWDTASLKSYVKKSRNVDYDDFRSASYSAQEMYKSRALHPDLDPKGVIRECCDSEEHPETVPVILALDVTGSMGKAAVLVAQKLDDIMTKTYTDGTVKDVEFCIMGIGDLNSDDAPVQISQFESDIRIAEHLDKVYFEGGGGGNKSESYSAAWYMGLNHCSLDCWKRGKKGIIITMGDELPNPVLPCREVKYFIGDEISEDVDTKALFNEVLEKFEVYHIAVDDPHSCYKSYNRSYHLDKEWTKLIGEDRYFVCNLDNLDATISDIVANHARSSSGVATITSEGISW